MKTIPLLMAAVHLSYTLCSERVVSLKTLAMESLCNKLEKQKISERFETISTITNNQLVPTDLLGDVSTDTQSHDPGSILGYLEQSRRWVLEPHHTYINERKGTTPLCFSPNGVYLALSEPAELNGDYIVNNTSKRIKVFDVCQKKPVFCYDNFLARACSVKFVGNKKILFETDDERLHLYDLEKKTDLPLTHQDSVDVVTVSTDGTCILTANKSLFLWKIAPDEFSRTELKRSSFSFKFKSAIFLSHGDIAAGNSNGKLYLFAGSNKKSTSRIDFGADAINQLAKTSDDKKIIIGTIQGSLFVFDRSKWNSTKLAQENERISFLHVHNDNTIVYATNHIIKTIDLISNNTTTLLSVSNDRITSIAMTPDTKGIICCIKPMDDDDQKSALIGIDLHNNGTRRLDCHAGTAHRLAVSNNHVAYNSHESMVQIERHSMKWHKILQALPAEVINENCQSDLDEDEFA
jgi:hypothetical protein